MMRVEDLVKHLEYAYEMLTSAQVSGNVETRFGFYDDTEGIGFKRSECGRLFLFIREDGKDSNIELLEESP